MPGPLLHVGAVFTCPHAAPGQVVSSNARVLVSGMPVATMADTYPITGCPFQVPVGAGTKPQPCVRVQWLVPAARVLVNGTPPILATSGGIALSVEQIPQGPPIVSTVQPRVVAT
jgi:uncharacterized Zn-binding protein involved in type VI secretion